MLHTAAGVAFGIDMELGGLRGVLAGLWHRPSLLVTTSLLLFTAAGGGGAALAPTTEPPDQSPCQVLLEAACSGPGYEETAIPESIAHKLPNLASEELLSFLPLLQVGCSEGLREFLCALYMPMCTNYGFHLPPCRSLCKKAREGCEEAMTELDLSWPSKFDCTRFPEHHELMCVVTLNQSRFVDTTTTTIAAAAHTTASPLPLYPHHHSALTPCSSNADCVFERAVCRGGECVCQYPLTWGSTGCEYTQILGGQCTSDSQCSSVTPNAVCNNSVCSCVPPLTSYLNLACIHGSGIGDMCYNDAQCRALNYFSFCRLSVAGVVGVCTCDPDQFIDSRGRCVPRLGGRCHKGDCPRQLGAASCQRGRDAVLKCFCRKEAVQRRGVCIPPA